MITNAIGSTSSTAAKTSSTDSIGSGLDLSPSDFIQMMVTQLQNQDPTQPMSNQDLLSQMSQIGQLQSQSDLTTNLKSMTLQTSLGSAGNLIGKNVTGTDDTGDSVDGLVNAVRVEDSNVYLDLDNGKSLQLNNVLSIKPAAATSAAVNSATVTTPTTTTPTAPTAAAA